MRVLVLTDLYPPDVQGGYELGCRQAVEALRARGHEVRVLTSAPRSPAPSEPHVARTLRLVDAWSEYLFTKNTPLTNHLEQSESLRVSAHNVHALLHELDEFRPDVVYVWLLVGVGGLGLMATLEHQAAPWVWHLMDDVPLMLCRTAGRVRSEFTDLFNRHLRGSYLACSRQLVEEIEAGGVRLADRVETIPNWVVGDRYPSPRSDGPRKRLRIVSAAGVIDRQLDKGIDLLIESAAILAARHPRAFAVDLYGRSADGHAEHLIHRFGVEDYVTLHGPRTQAELSEIFARTDVFAFPTRPREPFGFAPLEAAARGCVPVISETCGLAEWFVHGVHLLKAERTPESFARVFARILDGEVALSPIARRAASVIARGFHIDAIAPRIEAALAREAGRRKPKLGPSAEAYRLALLAEKLSRVAIQESYAA